MSFLNPTYLFGLFGLAVPIAIHLWSKREGRVIKVGSIKFLPEAETKKSSSVHLNEIWLLLLRCLLISVLVLILADPYYKSTIATDEKVVLIEPSLADNDKASSIADSLSQQGFEMRWFTKGFPMSYSKVDTTQKLSYWHLLSDFDKLKKNELVLISTSKVTNVMGKRPTLTTPLRWITINENTPQTFEIQSVKLADDSTLTWVGESDQTRTTFVKNVTNASQVPTMDSLSICLIADEGFHHDEKYIKTGLETIQAYTKWPIKISTDTSQFSNWLIQLMETEEQLRNVDGERVLVYNQDTLANQLIVPSNRPHVFNLTSRLNEATVRDGDLINMLFSTIRDEAVNYQEVVAANDQRLIDEKQLQPNYHQAELSQFINKPFHHLLWLLLIVLFFAERAMAYIRKQ